MDCKPDTFDAYNRRGDAGNLRRAWGMPSVNSWYKGTATRPSVTWPFSLLKFQRGARGFNPDGYCFR